MAHGSLALFLLGGSGLPPVGRCLPLFRAFPFTAARDPGDLIDQKLSLRWRDRPRPAATGGACYFTLVLENGRPFSHLKQCLSSKHDLKSYRDIKLSTNTLDMTIFP